MTERRRERGRDIETWRERGLTLFLEKKTEFSKDVNNRHLQEKRAGESFVLQIKAFVVQKEKQRIKNTFIGAG